MKPLKIVLPLIAALAFGVTGCKKEETLADKANNAADSAVDGLKKAADSAKDAGQKLAQDASKEGQKIADAASAKAQEYIDKAKKLVAESKYQDAMNSLKALSDLKLSPEQQKVVDDLKVQIQKALGATPAFPTK